MVLTFPFDDIISHCASRATNAQAISPAGEAVHKFPPTVATWRICLDACLFAASYKTGNSSCNSLLEIISFAVTRAPILMSLSDFEIDVNLSSSK